MRRGTTPTHTFELPFDVSEVKSVQIIYKQEKKYPFNSIVVTKNTSDCRLNGKEISVTLTQSDTLAFDNNQPVEIQLRVLTKNNTALVSDVITKNADVCLNNEVLT